MFNSDDIACAGMIACVDELRSSQTASTLEPPVSMYPTFRYVDADGFDFSPTARVEALEGARALLTEDGGVLYDDSRAFIVVDSGANANMEGSRVSGELSPTIVGEVLDWLQGQGRDWFSPLTRDELHRAHAEWFVAGDGDATPEPGEETPTYSMLRPFTWVFDVVEGWDPEELRGAYQTWLDAHEPNYTWIDHSGEFGLEGAVIQPLVYALAGGFGHATGLYDGTPHMQIRLLNPSSEYSLPEALTRLTNAAFEAVGIETHGDSAMSYVDRYDSHAHQDLVHRFERFPLLAGRLQNMSKYQSNPIRYLSQVDHLGTRRLAHFLCAHYYDNNAGGIDVVDLIQRLDATNRAVLLAYLREI